MIYRWIAKEGFAYEDVERIREPREGFLPGSLLELATGYTEISLSQ